MKKNNPIFLILLGVFLLSPLKTYGMGSNKNENQDRVEKEYIVKLREGKNKEVLRQIFSQYGVESIEEIAGGYYLIKLTKDPGAKEIKKVGQRAEEIYSIQPNYKYKAF